MYALLPRVWAGLRGRFQRCLMLLESTNRKELKSVKTTTSVTRCSSKRLFSSTTISSTPPRTTHDDGQHSSLSLPQIIQTKGVPIHLYADEIETQALEQVKILAESPVPVDFVAVMPDAHLGKGVTVGTVFASTKYICPNAVGVDIGCGMAAVPIEGLYKKDLTQLQKAEIQRLLKERIPTGFGKHTKALAQTSRVLDKITAETQPTLMIEEQLRSLNVTHQLGTLGGGNHFLEVVYDDTPAQQVWCLLHSGSRNIGNRVAQQYDKIAKHLLQQQGIDTAPLQGLHYMLIDSEEGQNYLRDMNWCQQYSFQNRQAMLEIMLQVMHKVTGKEADRSKAVNIHHNYCRCEECRTASGDDGDDDRRSRQLWVTRKGATSAAVGEYGIIPGSMGTGSFITRGKGNPDSWSSSSHGAGRKLSRTQAHKQISQHDFETAMSDIVCDTHPNVRDEAPQAYKDLGKVMEQQASLTEIVHQLRPLVNVKGFETKGGGSSSRSNSKKGKKKHR